MQTQKQHIESARSPEFTKNNSINLWVKFSDMEEELPYTAKLDPREPVASELYTRALEGEFGEVKSYVVDINELIQQRTQELTLKINMVLYGGVKVNGITFDTDNNAISAYNNYLVRFQINPILEIPNWKASKDTWVTMNKDLLNQVVTAYDEVKAYCFEYKKTITDQIADLVANDNTKGLQYLVIGL